jgi:hypothetical protein
MNHDRRNRADGECSGKEIMTFTRARKVAKEMRRKHDDKLQHYKCPTCKGWHIGSRA